MTLKLNRTAEKSKMEKGSNSNSQEKSPEAIALEQENKLLKEQLNKLSSAQESLALEKEAEKLAKEKAALEEEANLRKALGEHFSETKKTLKDGEELSNEQMIAIMGDAVGAASEAQAKLILKQVAEMVRSSKAELKQTQKLLFELAAATSMNQVRSKYSDYDDYKTEVAGIMSTTKGLSPEDAYMLAKAKRSKDQPDKEQTFSERPGEPPTPTPSSRDEYVQSREDIGSDVHRSPKAVFSAAVEAAIKKVTAARQG